MLLPIDLPPGLVGDGTTYQAKGRWRDGTLIRWFDNTLAPIGGWTTRDGTVEGAPRCIISWQDNSASEIRWLAIGTHTKLYSQPVASSSVYDITPVGFTTGEEDSTIGGGYGAGLYGVGTYGTPGADETNIIDATVWSLDTYGESLVGVSSSDQTIYEWVPDPTSPPPAAAITNAPSARALVVTAERSIMALGADGDLRRVAWCDLEDNTDWTPTALNQAGDFTLQTTGALLCGRRVSSGTLLLTTTDAWLATYQNATFVYGFESVGQNCGAISQGALVSLGPTAVWLSKSGFWLFDGASAQHLPSERDDYVFSDINLNQAAKVTAFHNSQFGEVWWFYPSGSATENDRYVVWQYRDGHWNGGELSRTCAVNRGTYARPVMVDADGAIYDHEIGYSYGGLTPWARSGPIELGNGDQVMMARCIIPDEKTLGDVTASFHTRFYPTDSATEHGPYAPARKTDIRLTGRTVELEVSGATASDWRFGTPRLDVIPVGQR